MDVLTGAFQILAVVIAVGGVAKLVSPSAFAATLRSLGLPGGRVAARCAGAVELVLGTAALVLGGTLLALGVAAAYAVFAVVVAAARRRGAASCGCFGAVDAPPSRVHVVVNSVSAAVALAAAAVVPPGLVDVLADQPMAGVPYLIALATGAWLTIVLDTTGAALVEEMAAVAELGPTFRNNARAATVPARTVPRTARTRPTRNRQD